MTTRQIAAAMGLPPRSYLHFEAGGGRLSVDLVFRFAQATDSDPYAILAAVFLGMPELAAYCANNKMMIAMAIALQEFTTEQGPEIQRLETTTLVAAFSNLFQGLATEVRSQADWAEKFLHQKSPNVGVPTKRKSPDKADDDD
ncbi:hypothetical protein [Phenylobacterium sp.]|uniref:hypothetical protein n=1 Tax=Phenylobacterium sp. TaxID=1871053 RepID=UPI003BAD04C9